MTLFMGPTLVPELMVIRLTQSTPGRSRRSQDNARRAAPRSIPKYRVLICSCVPTREWNVPQPARASSLDLAGKELPVVAVSANRELVSARGQRRKVHIDFKRGGLVAEICLATR